MFFEEDPDGTVAIIEQRAKIASFHRLYIDGVSNSGDPVPSLRYMRLQALLPLIVQRSDPRAALVIGFGTAHYNGSALTISGFTAARLRGTAERCHRRRAAISRQLPRCFRSAN